ncbi:MAG: HAMP domain-containing protein [Hydrogenothermaceae bacterium]|nr:HAMP domain-containing protein [Hydrogenothermaceae bacterium]
MSGKKSSVLNKISIVVLFGSIIGAVFVGIMVYMLLSPVDPKALNKALISTVVIQITFLIPVYLIRVLINRMVVTKLNTISKAMNEISMGNLDYEIKIEKTGDELEELADSFERMRISMKTIMEKLEKGEL